jgi:hypothetical protein
MKSKLITLSLIVTQSILFSQVTDSPEITKEEIQEHINFLASDKMKGRDSGSEELKMSAVYISDEFKNYGLEPFFNGDFLQEFPFISHLELTENNSLIFNVGSEKISPELEEEYLTVPFSGKIDLSSELVFAGFGISAADLEYDDYSDIDVKGKILIIVRGTPDPKDPHSKFDAHSSLRKKSAVARDKGAAGIIFVNGYEEFKMEDDLVRLEYDIGGSVTDFGVVSVKKSVIEKLFKSVGKDFKESYNKIVEEKKPASFEFENISVELKTEVQEVEKITWNVAGYIEGNDPELKKELIVIGAHFDHLGMGGVNSLDRSGQPQIHNGADDNASGTTGVLELAEKFASVKNELKRSILFVAFSGEELGLLGSSYFVRNLSIPAEDIITMINMDMIGRLKDSSLIVYGTGTSSGWKELLNQYNNYGFKLSFNDEGFGPSDHSSFYGAKIPVLFFFTGTHEDYHKTSDDADKINAEGTENILKYAYNIVLDINNSDDRPDYILVEKKESQQMFVRKVYVGTVPDFASNVDGYKISGVSEGSPAQIAGLQGGDIIVSFGGKKISNIYDFTYALGDFVPGDVVDVIVKRGNEELNFEITLAAR